MHGTRQVLVLALIPLLALASRAQDAAWPEWMQAWEAGGNNAEARQLAIAPHLRGMAPIWRALRAAEDVTVSATRMKVLAGDLDALLERPLFGPEVAALQALPAEVRLALAAARRDLDAAWGARGQLEAEQFARQIETAITRLESLAPAADRSSARLVALFRLRQSGRTSREAAIRGLTDLVAAHEQDGLGGWNEALTARIATARFALSDGRLEVAEDALARQRAAGGADGDVAILLRTRLVALELELGRLRGDDAMLFALAEEFEQQLVPALGAWTRSGEADLAAREEVLAYEMLIAQRLARLGAHDRALALLRRPTMAMEDRFDAVTAARVELLTGQTAEAAGQPALARSQAARTIARLGSVPAASGHPQGLVQLMRWQAVLLETSASVLLGDLAEATAGRDRARALAAAARSALPEGSALAVDADRLAGRHDLVEGLVADLLGDLASAIAAFERAESHLRGHSGAIERHQVAWSRTHVLLRLGDVDGALAAAREARDRALEAEEDRDWADVASAVALAEVQIRTGRFTAARLVLEEGLLALNPTIEAVRPVLVAELYRLLAEVDQARAAAAIPSEDTTSSSAARAAKAHLARAMSVLQPGLAKKTPSPALITEALRCLRLEASLPVAEAEPVLVRARKLLAGVPRDRLTRRTFGAVRALHATIEAEAALTAGDRRAALRWFDKALADRGGLRTDRRVRPASAGPSTDAPLERRALALALELAADSASPLDAARALTLRERLTAEDTRAILKAARLSRVMQVSSSSSPRPRPRPRAAQALQQFLSPGRAALIWTVCDDRTFLMLARGSGTEVRTVPVGREQLKALVDGLRSTLAGPADPFAWRTALSRGHALQDLLVAPFAEQLKTVRELVIVPDGPLHALPVAALVLGKQAPASPEGARFLIDLPELEVLSIAPGLTAVAELDRSGASDSIDRAVLLGAPAGLDPTAWPPLPHAALELEQLAERLEDRTARVLSGADANHEELEAALTDTPDLLHFATHGTGSAGSRRVPELVLAPSTSDGSPDLLGPVRVASLPLQGAPLVVLNACASVPGQALGHEGCLGLPRAFLVAGARAVVATTQRISDRRGAGFMAAFYERLLSDPQGRAGRALLDAQRALSAADETRWPGSWASYVLVGTPR